MVSFMSHCIWIQVTQLLGALDQSYYTCKWNVRVTDFSTEIYGTPSLNYDSFYFNDATTSRYRYCHCIYIMVRHQITETAT